MLITSKKQRTWRSSFLRQSQTNTSSFGVLLFACWETLSEGSEFPNLPAKLYKNYQLEETLFQGPCFRGPSSKKGMMASDTNPRGKYKKALWTVGLMKRAPLTAQRFSRHFALILAVSSAITYWRLPWQGSALFWSSIVYYSLMVCIIILRDQDIVQLQNSRLYVLTCGTCS